MLPSFPTVRLPIISLPTQTGEFNFFCLPANLDQECSAAEKEQKEKVEKTAVMVKEHKKEENNLKADLEELQNRCNVYSKKSF
jgi:hypothetical protein